MALRLTSADDYAVRAMIHLACLPEGASAMRNDIAEVQKIPGSYMAKILRKLVRAGLLRSSRGVNGGFSMARPAAEISLLEIVEAIEGPLGMAPCVPDPTRLRVGLRVPRRTGLGRGPDDHSGHPGPGQPGRTRFDASAQRPSR